MNIGLFRVVIGIGYTVSCYLASTVNLALANPLQNLSGFFNVESAGESPRTHAYIESSTIQLERLGGNVDRHRIFMQNGAIALPPEKYSEVLDYLVAPSGETFANASGTSDPKDLQNMDENVFKQLVVKARCSQTSCFFNSGFFGGLVKAKLDLISNGLINISYYEAFSLVVIPIWKKTEYKLTPVETIILD